jgi:Protein of unknown function (DUF3306)
MTRPTPDNERFLSRWSRLKRAQAESTDAASAVLPVAPGQPPATATATAATTTPQAAGEGVMPSLPSIESLTMESDYAQFFQAKVPESLRRAAVKKLFADPHFNIMDGLDTYIDDYSKSDPIPPEMLARLVQARDIIDHPSNRKPEDAGQAPTAATNETAGQPDKCSMTEHRKDVVSGPAQEQTAVVEQAAVGEQLAAASGAKPPAELSADPGTGLPVVPDTSHRPADPAA